MRSVREKYKGARDLGRGMSSILAKCVTTLFIILYSLSTISAQDLKIPERPNPPHLVNDMAGMLSQDDENNLESKLVAYSDSTSTQIAVITINSLEGNDIAQYASELGAKWGIGMKGKDNGVLLLISKSDRKAFIATGRGAEANLPDITAKRIVDRIIIPNFKQQKYYEGINAATDEMMARLSGQFTNDDLTNNKSDLKGWAKLIALIIVLIILFIIFFSGGSGGRTYNSGGSSGGSFLLGALLGSALGGGGGGGSSDGGGGGDFGGFGGGDFGGGGAGGDW